MKKLFVVFLSILVQLHAAAPAPPITLSSESTNSSDAQIVLDFEGTATALWLEDGEVKVNYLPLGGSWDTAEAISGSPVSQPKIVVDASGNLTVVWIDSGVLTTVYKALNGSWSSESAISSSGASNPQLAVSSAGDIVAVWERDGYIESATQPSGQSWGSVDTLSSSGADSPYVAIGGNGQVVVVWNQEISSVYTTLAAAKTISGSWGTGEEVSASGIHSVGAKVAVDPSGNAIAIWYHFMEDNSVYSDIGVAYAELPFGGSWGSPITIFESECAEDPSNLFVQILFDSEGTAIATWTDCDRGSSFSLYSTIKKPGKPWMNAVEFVLDNLYASSFDMAMNPNDFVVVSYMSYDPYTSTINIRGNSSYIEAYNSNYWVYVPPFTVEDINGYPKVASNKIDDLVYHVVIWLAYNGDYNFVQTSLLGYIDLMPATNLQVAQSSTDFGIFTEYYNTLTWDASVTGDVQGYYILRGGLLIGETGSSELEFIDHHRTPGNSNTYSVAAINSYGLQSPLVTVTYP